MRYLTILFPATVGLITVLATPAFASTVVWP
jgi:hypothetical protein